MKVEIKQNWSNGLWWVKPADDEARMKYRANHLDNGMWTNEQVAKVAGAGWLQAFMHGIHLAGDWHTFDVK